MADRKTLQAQRISGHSGASPGLGMQRDLTVCKLVDTTTSSSWDAYAQGFRSPGVPNMNCPGQNPNDPFFGYTLGGTSNYLQPAVVNGAAVPANTGT